MKKALLLSALIALIGGSLILGIVATFDYFFDLGKIQSQYRLEVICLSAFLVSIFIYFFGVVNKRMRMY